MKTIRYILYVLLFIFVGTLSWEYFFSGSEHERWISRFEEKLYRQERRADRSLHRLATTDILSPGSTDKDLIYVVYEGEKLLFWTNKCIGSPNLRQVLFSKQKFVYLNNTYYELRHLTSQERDYFALLYIRDYYPYESSYVQNHFGSYLDIRQEDVQYITVTPFLQSSTDVQMYDYNKEPIFALNIHEEYRERSVNYALLILYSIVYLGILYLFSRAMRHLPRERHRWICVGVFIAIITLIMYMIHECHFPMSIYRICQQNKAPANMFSEVELLLFAFSVLHFVSTLFTSIKSEPKENPRIMRYRLFCISLNVAIVLLLWMLVKSIHQFLLNSDIYLNISQLMSVEASSVVAFSAIMCCGMSVLFFIGCCARILSRSLPQREQIFFAVLVLGGFAVVSSFYEDSIIIVGSSTVLVISLFFIWSAYRMQKEMQRSIYFCILFILSCYIGYCINMHMSYKEEILRAKVATELFEERDYDFEKELSRTDFEIRSSSQLESLASAFKLNAIKELITIEFLGLNGYNYSTECTLFQTENHSKARTYYTNLVTKHGNRIGNTNFYALNIMDGKHTYLYDYTFGDVQMYILLEADIVSEQIGYPQILSHNSFQKRKIPYDYSYAKYKNGQLIGSAGTFNYHKLQDRFETNGEKVSFVNKEDYSHMLFKMNSNTMLVISLPKSFRQLYLMNILYSFLLCVLISYIMDSFGIKIRREEHALLKSKIKYSTFSLVFILFVILTTLSIYLNINSFKNRHNTKTAELLKYVSRETERMTCVDASICPEVNDVLSKLSSMLMTDINIYSTDGRLLSSSCPRIFSLGFDGTLIDPAAQKALLTDMNMSYVHNDQLCELNCLSAYMPLMLSNGENYILNVPYFIPNDELQVDIANMVVIAINVAILIMVLGYVLSVAIADRVTKPIQSLNENLRQMRLDGINEKIQYLANDEVGQLVNEYNNMVTKLENNVQALSRLERESAWREMARQIAHEIKNPLTPMKLNIQFLQRTLASNDMGTIQQKFSHISAVLIEQIDNMASIATTFSDFAKLDDSRRDTFNLSEMVQNCADLFRNNFSTLNIDIESDVYIHANREQIHRVVVNLLKNAEQCIPDERNGQVDIKLEHTNTQVLISIHDNGCGIPENLRKKIFEPNFTTKSSGTGLGLAISKRIVESSNGTISFESQEGNTTFFIYLPSVSPN